MGYTATVICACIMKRCENRMMSTKPKVGPGPYIHKLSMPVSRSRQRRTESQTQAERIGLTKDRRISIRGQIVAKKLGAGIKIVAKQSTTGCHNLDSGAEFFGHDAAFYQNSVQVSSLTFHIWHEFLTFWSCFVCSQGCVAITGVWVLSYDSVSITRI